MSSVEFSSVEITKALHGGIKGASEILGKSEQDFIHSALALAVGKVVRENFETVHLDGESVEDDVESLRRYYSLKREGAHVSLMFSGDHESFENISKAMELVAKEIEGEDFEEDENFKLFFKNIGHEGGCVFLRSKLILPSSEEGRSYKELELEVREEEAKYRAERGYLESEIPIGFGPRVYQSIVDPHLFLSQMDWVTSLAQQIDAGDFTIREVVFFAIMFRQLGKESRQKLENFLGKKRMERIKRLIDLKAKAFITSGIDEVLDMIEGKDVQEEGEDEEKTDS